MATIGSGPCDGADEMDSKKGSLSVLTIGDGDFSGSLALMRAYGHHIETMVATTLVPSEEELVSVYPNASAVLASLRQFGTSKSQSTRVSILFGVNATQLHRDSRLKGLEKEFDYILFHHPHIGYGVSDGDNEGPGVGPVALATMHSSLLAHYLYSAKCLLLQQQRHSANERANGTSQEHRQRQSLIHVCLCAGMSKSWKLHQAANHLDLKVLRGRPRFVSAPLFSHLTASEPADHWDQAGPQQQQQHDHWLGRYGYQHQPTHPSTTTTFSTVTNSHHYFLELTSMTGVTVSSSGGLLDELSQVGEITPTCLDATAEKSRAGTTKTMKSDDTLEKASSSGGTRTRFKTNETLCQVCRQKGCEYDE